MEHTFSKFNLVAGRADARHLSSTNAGTWKHMRFDYEVFGPCRVTWLSQWHPSVASQQIEKVGGHK